MIKHFFIILLSGLLLSSLSLVIIFLSVGRKNPEE